MEEPISGARAANSGYENEVLVLHAADAHEWATYLQQLLKMSRKFSKRSILLYTLGPDDQLHGYNYECFQCCTCILLLVTGELLDMLGDQELHEALQRLLSPPCRVVALLCGVTEDDEVKVNFEDWPWWRKISAEDEAHVYISTILETIADSRRVLAQRGSKAVVEELNRTENPTADAKEEVLSEEQIETTQKDEEQASAGNSESDETSASTHLSCLTVQPNRVLCGEPEKLFIIFTHKLDNQSTLEVEFSSEKGDAQRVAATLENEYTISVSAPDMPIGVVTLTMHTDQFAISLQPVTYYTHMGEISHFLENAADPVDFVCQAFNLTSNATESLDEMLTESLKSKMPATSFQLFGVKQIEEDNMAAYQRNEELPTLLHFAAKYGLTKLTAVLQQCPGALQAYSVMNKHGDYPNKLAEKSGFSDLRRLMDKFVDTAAMLKSPFEDAVNTDEVTDVYEMMTGNPQDILITEDIYESMFRIDPECVEDLYEEMSGVDENPEEVMLRKFFRGKESASVNQDNEHLKSEKAENESDHTEGEEDVYTLNLEDIYDTVDENCSYNSIIQNRPPAPLPRPDPGAEPEKPMIFRVFSDKSIANGGTTAGTAGTAGMGCAAAKYSEQPPSPAYDPYAGMKTPGQRQLISLQERVKVGEITVDEAVSEFKAWKVDQDRRASSIRYQQENLKRLRDSITRRHKERQKAGKELDYEISAPLQRNLYWGSNMTVECAVYEPAPRLVTLPPAPPAAALQRGSWKTGSTSSTSSTESNRLSTHSTFSYSSGTEPDFEDISEVVPPPPRPPRPSEAGANIAPPRIPPRVPERVPEKMLHERYIPCPTRAIPQRPSQRHADLAPPVPRRLR